MSEHTENTWTQEHHTNARAWCKGGGSKSREFAAALDEIERLQAHQPLKTYANCPRCHIVLEIDDIAGECPNCLAVVITRKLSDGLQL